MNCRCPKCSAPMEFNAEESTDAGLQRNCPSCRISLVIVRESFSCRASRPTEEIVCSRCGSELGKEPFCSNCGTPFPDYYLAEDYRRHVKRVRARTRREFRLPAVTFDLFSRRRQERLKSITSSGLTHEGSIDLARQERAVDAREVTSRPLSRFILWALIVILAAAALGGGYYVYRQKEKEKEFASLTMKALYRVKAGKDMAADACSTLVSSFPTSGSLKLSPPEQKRIMNAGTEIDRTLAALNAPSKQYEPAMEHLRKMNQAGVRYRSLALAPPPTIEALAEEMKRLEQEFSTSATSFKNSLPERMRGNLEEARRVYRPLQNF